MPSYYRRDEWVTDAQGNAISGAGVYVCSQPATTNTIPPSPLVQLYADPNGVTPLAQPVQTDGYGHAFYYVSPGIYTVVYYSPQIQQVTLLDQDINAGSVAIPVPINQGGTGATTANQAIVNLGAAARGANTDITSLGAIPNTVIDTNGYLFGQAYTTSNPGVQIADQVWSGSGYTGWGLGVQNSTGQTLIGGGAISTSGGVTAETINAITLANVGELRVGSTGLGVIQTFTAGQTLQIGAQPNLASPPTVSVQIDSTLSAPTSGKGLLGFDTNYATQTTVGAAGSASVIPGAPRGWLQFQAPDGTLCVFPYWAQS